MPEYIDVQIDTDPLDVLNDFVLYMQAIIPGWTPAPGQLDFWLAQAMAPAAAESRDVASAVPKSIFRWFGATLLNIPPVDAASASCTSKWTMINNAGYTIPAGTQVSIALTGDQVYAFETQVDVVVPPGSTLATGVQLIASEPGAAATGLGSVNGPVTLLDPLSFVTTITQDAVTTGGVDAEDDDTYLTRLATQLQLLAPRPILPADFAVFAKQIAGVKRAVGIDGYNPQNNLLTLDEASFETGVTRYGATNCVIAQSATFALDGANSLRMTASSAADMSAQLLVANAKACVPGDVMTATVAFRTPVTQRLCKVGIQWFDNANALISTSFGTAQNDLTIGWLSYSATATAPVNAVKAGIIFYVTAPANAEIHYVDQAALYRGTSLFWVPGGSPEFGNARTVAVAAIDANGTALDATHKAAVLADLQARREVNFIISVIDPQISIIDVTWKVKALSGYDTVALLAAINAAIVAYLAPSTWGATGGDPTAWTNQPTIRYLELAQVINNVAGVDYITTTGGNMDLSFGVHGTTLTRVDLTLPGTAPLPTTVGGTITGTVT